MKKTRNKKTTLHLEREVVRILQAHELRDVEGGRFEEAKLTTDSKNVCCA